MAKALNKSRVTNGSHCHVENVGHNKWSIRWRDLYDSIVEEFGLTTEQHKQVARRVATLQIAAERLELRCAKGQEINGAEYSTITNSIMRATQALRDAVAPPPAQDPQPSTPEQDAEQRAAERQAMLASMTLDELDLLAQAEGEPPIVDWRGVPVGVLLAGHVRTKDGTLRVAATGQHCQPTQELVDLMAAEDERHRQGQYVPSPGAPARAPDQDPGADDPDPPAGAPAISDELRSVLRSVVR
jgi:hypothetical protein